MTLAIGMLSFQYSAHAPELQKRSQDVFPDFRVEQPGRMQFTRICLLASSTAMLLLIPTTPHLAAS